MSTQSPQQEKCHRMSAKTKKALGNISNINIKLIFYIQFKGLNK